MKKNDLHIKRIEDGEEFTHRGGTLYIEEGIGKRATVNADSLVVGKPEDINTRTTPVVGEGSRVFSNEVRSKKALDNSMGDMVGNVFGDNYGTIKNTFVGNELVESTISDNSQGLNSFNDSASSLDKTPIFDFNGVVGKNVLIDTSPMTEDGLTLPCDIFATAFDEGVEVIAFGDVTVGGVPPDSKIKSYGGNITLHIAEGAHIETSGNGKINVESMAVSGSKLYTENGDISVSKMDSSSEAITVSGDIKIDNANGARIQTLKTNKHFGNDLG